MSDGLPPVKRVALNQFPGEDVDPIRLRKAFEMGAWWMLDRAFESSSDDDHVNLDDLRALFGPAQGGG